MNSEMLQKARSGRVAALEGLSIHRAAVFASLPVRRYNNGATKAPRNNLFA